MLKTLPRHADWLTVAAIAAAALPLLGQGAYGLRLFTAAGIYALLAVGYQLVFGAVGALSLAQGAFFGIGAYAAGILGARHGVAPALVLPASILAASLLAAVVAAPVLRLQSHYFALATLGIAQLALLFAVNAETLTGGANGIAGVPSIAPRGWGFALLAWTAAAVAALLAWRWTAARRGALALLRDDAIAAECLGIDTGALRFAAFVFSAAAAGLAGALHAQFLGVVSPEALEFPVMVACLSMVVIGGRLKVAGAAIGALLLVQLPEWLRAVGAWYMVAYGAALLAVVVFAPDGIAGALERAASRLFPAAPAAPPKPIARARAVRGASLSLRGVAKRFGGVAALGGISLEVKAGELLGIVGPNGSGKTTIVNLASGIHRPDAGSIALDGAPIAGQAPFRIARMGVARGFQAPRLLDSMSVLDNVALGARGDAPGAAMHWIERLGISHLARRRCGDLPGGARRRVEIARAMAGAPRLLLLDEPAAGLTPDEQNDLAGRLRAFNREGLTIVVVEHAVPFLAALATRLICLVEGRIAADGAPGEVTRDPAVIAAYLGRAWEQRR